MRARYAMSGYGRPALWRREAAMAAHTIRNAGVFFPPAFMLWVPALAQESSADRPESDAVCRFCPHYTGLSGWVELGPGYQSEDSL
jgi:hypothetical protein